MYERFTDRARKALQLANQEAQKCNREYIDAEHVLLGILAEGGGMACVALESLGIRLSAVAEAVRKTMDVAPPSDRWVMGKLPQTPRGKKVVEHAIAEAARRHDNYVGTEHLLAGLLLEPDGLAGDILTVNFDVTPEKFWEAADSVLGSRAKADEPTVVGKPNPPTFTPAGTIEAAVWTTFFSGKTEVTMRTAIADMTDKELLAAANRLAMDVIAVGTEIQRRFNSAEVRPTPKSDGTDAP